MTDEPDMRASIEEVFGRIWEEETGAKPPELHDDTVLLETGLDSLGFAVFVTELEDVLGFDPFALSADAYYPQTFGEFVAFYRAHAPTEED